jgi:hypothetical protein
MKGDERDETAGDTIARGVEPLLDGKDEIHSTHVFAGGGNDGLLACSWRAEQDHKQTSILWCVLSMY